MMLQSVEFVQYEGKPLEWRIEGLTFQPINLIVGRNASGKSKALGLLRELAALLSGSSPDGKSGSYVARFRDPESAYALAIRDTRVLHEELTIEGDKKLTREEDGTGQIYFTGLGQLVSFQYPERTPVCGNRHDLIQHPYLEPLYAWSKAVYYYEFSSSAFGKDEMHAVPNRMLEQRPPHEAFNDAIGAVHLDAFGGNLRASIVRDMNHLGYPITAVGTENILPPLDPTMRIDSVYLYVNEAGLGDAINQFDMSDGMFRALSILIEVTYATMTGTPSLVLIDDIGDGLDYERSCLLIKLLIEKAKTSGIQLVMATNDRFVMNNVPLEHWSILVRQPSERGTLVKVHNYANSKKAFDEFAYTGLNNFDFFATGFFEQGLDGDE